MAGKAKQRGGVFVGPPPKDVGKHVEEKAIKDRVSPDGTIEDDIFDDVNTSDPTSFVTFARGNAVGLLTHKSVSNIARRNKQDPATRLPLHPEVIEFGLQRPNSPAHAIASRRTSSSLSPRRTVNTSPNRRISSSNSSVMSSRNSSRTSSETDDEQLSERLEYIRSLARDTSMESEDIRRHLQDFVDEPVTNLTDTRLSGLKWGNTLTFKAHIHRQMRDIHHLLTINNRQDYSVLLDCNIYYLHILPDLMNHEHMTIIFAAKLGREQRWYVVRYSTQEQDAHVEQLTRIPENSYYPSAHILQQLEEGVRTSVRYNDELTFTFPLVKYDQPILFLNLTSPSTGGGHARNPVLHKTQEKATIGNQTRVVYTNARGTKFIRLNGTYMHLSKALKIKQ